MRLFRFVVPAKERTKIIVSSMLRETGIQHGEMTYAPKIVGGEICHSGILPEEYPGARVYEAADKAARTAIFSSLDYLIDPSKFTSRELAYGDYTEV